MRTSSTPAPGDNDEHTPDEVEELMGQITASVVRELREKSGAGMMECKKALEATGGDIEAAFDELRKSGLKTAEKKAGRATGEGRVATALSSDGKRGAMVAISCETDFVAKTPDFEGYLSDLAGHVLEHGPKSVDELMGQAWKAGGTVDEGLKGLIGKLGENIQISECACYANPEGQVAAYIHHDQKKGAIVDVTTGADAAAAGETLKSLCMHIVVFNPAAANRDSVSAEDVERERNIIKEGLAGKPEEIQEKIMLGRLEKFYAERVVTEQPWIKDDKSTVQKALEGTLGGGTQLRAFSRFQIGE
ncbi:MAG: translation elongation factor Ts [bacterium]|nr:translation elongation factor Ts [bacterium]